MNRDAQLTLPWVDGDHVFRLGWGELELLQEECNAGPYVILDRLQNDSWRLSDIASTIRLGLIGGGMAPAAANKKVQTWVKSRPPLENLVYAQAILSAGVVGAPEENVGELSAVNQEVSPSTTFPMES